MTLHPRLPSFRADWACFAGICVLALLLRLSVAGIPLERDEGEYAYTAQRWMQGEIPYRDSFDQKPPGIFAAYALIEHFVGVSPAAIHWGAQLYTLATLALLFILGRQLSSAATGLAAAAFAAFMTTAPGVWGNAANTELFMILPLTAAMLAACRAADRQSPPWALATGALAAMALLFKQMAVTNLVFYVLFLTWAWRRRWLAAALVLFGIASVVLPVWAYFAAHGAADAFYDATIGYNLHYATRTPLALYPQHFWSNFLVLSRSFWPLLVLATVQTARVLFCAATLEGAAAQPVRRNTFLVIAWLAASFVGTASGGYFTPHYFMQTVPALAVLAGMAVGETNFQQVSASLRRLAVTKKSSPVPHRLIPVALVAGAISIGVLSNSWYYLPGSVDPKLFRLYGFTPFADSPAVAHFIREHSEPSDTVFVLGSEAQILYYAARKSATRYFYIYPLVGPYPSARERQYAALREVAQNNPRFIVTVFLPSSFLGGSETPRDIAEAVRYMLDQSYRVVGVVGYTEGVSSEFVATEFVTGERAEQAWRSAPVWYGTPSWCALAVWERVTPASRSW